MNHCINDDSLCQFPARSALLPNHLITRLGIPLARSFSQIDCCYLESRTDLVCSTHNDVNEHSLRTSDPLNLASALTHTHTLFTIIHCSSAAKVLRLLKGIVSLRQNFVSKAGDLHHEAGK